jgi:drug/metabolite transporter (DMT)-like permease
MPSLPVWPLLLGAGVLFGLGLPLSQLGARDGVDVLAFAVWPTLAAAVGLAALGWLRHGPLTINRRLLRFGLLAGTLGHAVPASAGYWLAREAGAGFAALAYTLPPALTLALSVLLRLEAPVARRIGAVALGVAGALLLVAGRGAALDVKPIAIAALLLIPLSIAGANVYRSVNLPKTVPAEWLAALMLGSSASVLAASGVLNGSLALPMRADALIWPALQAAAMVGAYLLFFALQRRAEPVISSFVGYVSMLTGTAVAAVGFGERVSAIAWPALALIAASMWLLRRATAADAAAAAEVDCPAAQVRCANDHCSVSTEHSMPFDCSARGALACA